MVRIFFFKSNLSLSKMEDGQKIFNKAIEKRFHLKKRFSQNEKEKAKGGFNFSYSKDNLKQFFDFYVNNTKVKKAFSLSGVKEANKDSQKDFFMFISLQKFSKKELTFLRLNKDFASHVFYLESYNGLGRRLHRYENLHSSSCFFKTKGLHKELDISQQPQCKEKRSRKKRRKKTGYNEHCKKEKEIFIDFSLVVHERYPVYLGGSKKSFNLSLVSKEEKIAFDVLYGGLNPYQIIEQMNEDEVFSSKVSLFLPKRFSLKNPYAFSNPGRRSMVLPKKMRYLFLKKLFGKNSSDKEIFAEIQKKWLPKIFLFTYSVKRKIV